MERVRFEDIVTRVNTKEDRFNTDKIYYVGGEHIEFSEVGQLLKEFLQRGIGLIRVRQFDFAQIEFCGVGGGGEFLLADLQGHL